MAYSPRVYSPNISSKVALNVQLSYSLIDGLQLRHSHLPEAPDGGVQLNDVMPPSVVRNKSMASINEFDNWTLSANFIEVFGE